MANLITGENDLYTLFPDLAKEWDYEKNGMYLPNHFSPGSNKKVWWKCKLCKYSWEAAIVNRTRGTGCPNCGKIRLKQGINDLLTTRPDIAEEWDWSKNDKSPSDYTYGNAQKVWWKCKRCGNNWQAKINNRTNGSGCPKCSRYTHTSFAEQVIYYYIKQIYKDAENSYRTEWLGRAEIDIFVPSIKLAIEYDGAHWHKNKASSDIQKSKSIIEHGIILIRIREPGCPDLGNDYNVVITSSPIGTGIYLVSALQELFRKLKDMGLMDVESPDIDIERDRQDILAQYAGALKDHSLPVVSPDLLKEWDYEKNGSLNPDQFSAHSSQKVWWICSNCGTQWAQMISSRTKGYSCPKCAANNRLRAFRKSIVEQRGSFESLFPDLIMEWDYTNNSIDPQKITARSNSKAWWICKECGNRWKMSIAARAGGCGCPVCGHKKAGKNRVNTLLQRGESFGEKRPDLFKEVDTEKNDEYIDLYVFLPYSRKEIWWKCSKCGYSWKASFSSRFSGRDCPECAEEKRKEAYRESILSTRGALSEINPKILIDWDYDKNTVDPRKITAGCQTIVWWKCSLCGYEWKASVASRAKKEKTDCPKCANIKRGISSRKRNLLPGINDLLSDNPELCQEWDYQRNAEIIPENCTRSSGLKVWWKCGVCHGVWQATIANRNIAKTKCPYCSNKKVLLGYNDLAHKFPEIAKEWSEENSPIKPENVIFSSHMRVKWCCSICGVIWESEIRGRTQYKAKCPNCK